MARMYRFPTPEKPVAPSAFGWAAIPAQGWAMMARAGEIIPKSAALLIADVVEKHHEGEGRELRTLLLRIMMYLQEHECVTADDLRRAFNIPERAPK